MVIGAAISVPVIVSEVVSVLFGEVEPDVRLKITSPASTKKGKELPLVLMRQVLVVESISLQQNRKAPSTSTKNIDASFLTATANKEC